MENHAPRHAVEGGRRRVFWLLVAVGVVVLAVVGYFVFLQLRAGQPESPTPDVPTSGGVASPSATVTPEPESTPTRTPEPSIAGPFTTPPTATPTESDALPELKPVDPGAAVEGRDGMQVKLTSIEAVTGQAVQPGEVAGPAIRVKVTITNGTDREFNTDTVVVNAYYGGQRTPADTLVRPGGVPFYGRVAPGQSTYGIYLFRVPLDQRKSVTVTVDYLADVPAVVFHGDFS